MKRSSSEDCRSRLVLALEASSRTYAVAVGDGENPRERVAAGRDDPAFPELGELVARAMARAGAAFSDIAAIGVDAGPGGLSSVRSAVAYANGLAFALGIKIFAISSLELMAIAAQPVGQGPVLCLKRGQGGNTYAGLFINGKLADLRHGPPRPVVPAMVGNLARIRVAGTSRDDVVGLLAGVIVEDSGVAEADVAVLYRATRAALAAPERLVPEASPINEDSRIFHPAAASRPVQRP